MSDLVLRALGQAVCLSTVGIFALVMSLVTLSSSSARSDQHCSPNRCLPVGAYYTSPVGLSPSGLNNPEHVKALAMHLWGTK